MLDRQLCELDLLTKAFAVSGEGEDARLIQLRSDIKRRADLLSAKYESFHNYISSVDDPFDRSALTLRYLYGMTWQQVAFTLGEYDEQYARRRCEKYTNGTKLVT